jgi:hypothetical protein
VAISPRSARNESAPAAADTSYLAVDELGDGLDVSVRLILAGATGRFFPSVSPDMTAGCCTQEGQVVGTVNATRDPLPVRNPWFGLLMGYLVIPGQRVSERTPVAWVTLDGVVGPNGSMTPRADH